MPSLDLFQFFGGGARSSQLVSAFKMRVRSIIIYKIFKCKNLLCEENGFVMMRLIVCKHL